MKTLLGVGFSLFSVLMSLDGSAADKSLRPGAALAERRAGPGILWAAPTASTPLFVSADNFLDADGEARPDWLTPTASQWLDNRLRAAEQRRLSQPSRPCVEYTPSLIHGDTLEPPPGRSPIDMSLKARRERGRAAVVLARVLSVTPGFNIDSLSPTDLVEVRVERVYRNRTAVALREGLTLRYQTRGGNLRIGGTDFCVRAEGDLAAQAGDLVLVLGTIDERLADYIYPDNPYGVLAVTAAKTVLLPSDRGEPESAMPLSDVPRNLDRLAPDQRRQAVTQRVPRVSFSVQPSYLSF